ncbi:MAG TPA: pre-peptidase C-terminal domain-containing protein [Pseudomonadales bacterium]
MADDHGNNTATAGTITVGGEATGNVDERHDEDWFGVQLHAGTTYWFEALGKRNDAGSADSPRLSLHDGQGSYIRGVVTGGANGDPLLAYTPLISGIHYVGVADSLGTGTYTLSAAIASRQDDYRDDAATAASIAIGSQVGGSLEVTTDQDWFRAELSAGATYVFELRGVDGGGGTAGGGDFDLGLRLSSAAGGIAVSSSRGGSGDPLLTYTAIESGTHYVQVSSQVYDAGAGTYTLSAAEIPTTVNFIAGTSGNDVLHATTANDLIAGTTGIDVVIYPGASTNYSASIDRFSKVISVSGNGNDNLHGIERIHYDDIGRAFDIVDGNAGMVAKTIGVVFGVDSVQNRAYVAKGLALADSGMGYEELAQYALDRALDPAANSSEIVNLLYKNVMRTPPPQAAVDFYTGLLDDGVVTPGWLAMYAAETVQNQLAVLGIRPAEYPLYFDIT